MLAECCVLCKVTTTFFELAFCECHSLISAELPPTVEVHDTAFDRCLTLELRQPQVDYNIITYDQRSHESARYLKVRNDGLPIHKICHDTNIIQD